MNKPHLIMPMGGAGSRFYKEGFQIPKPLIEIQGKPFLYWSTMSIKKYIDLADITFVVLQEHIDKWKIDAVIRQNFLDAKIVIIPYILNGPVLTCLEGIRNITDNSPVIFNDCDHMFKSTSLVDALNGKEMDEDGGLLTFKSDKPQYSYIKYNENGKIVGTIEKKVVSNSAICGAYIFKNAKTFKTAAKDYLNNCDYSEYFVSGVYNILCQKGLFIKDYLLDFHVEFGTPEEYKLAETSPYFTELIRSE